MSVVSLSVFSSRSSTFHVSSRVALFMDSILAIGTGLCLRFVVDVVSHHDLKLSGTIVGLWEGIVLLHFLQKFPYSFDPYVGYGVRLFVDFLVTESVSRLVLVVIWTGLGMVLADVSPGLWKETGMARKWHNLRRELYLVSKSVPTIPPLFPRQRTVRFSPSRTASVVSSAERSQADSRTPTEVSVSTSPPRRARAVPQTPRAPRRAVPGFFPSTTSETETDRHSAVIRPLGFSDTDSVITATTTNVGTASGFTRHDIFTPAPVPVPIPVPVPVSIRQLEDDIDDDNYSSDASSTTTEVVDPSTMDLPEIIVPEDPTTPRADNIEMLPEPEPEPEPEDNEPMPPPAEIPDMADADWETVDKDDAIPEQVVPPPPPPKDEGPLIFSPVPVPHASLFPVDRTALRRPSGVVTPEPKPIPAPVVQAGPPPAPIITAQRAPVKPALRTTTGYTPPPKPKSVVSMAAARFPTPEATPSEAGGPAESVASFVQASRQPLPEPTPSEAPTRWGAESTISYGNAPTEVPRAPESVLSYNAAGQPLPEPTPSEAPTRWGAESTISYRNKAPTEVPRAPESVLSYNAAGHPLPEPTPSEAPTRWGAESTISYKNKAPTEIPRAPESVLSTNAAGHPLPEPTPSEAPSRWGIGSILSYRNKAPTEVPRAPESVFSNNAPRHPLPEPTPSEAPSRWGAESTISYNKAPTEIPRAPESVFGSKAPSFPVPQPAPSEAPESVLSYGAGAARHRLPDPTPSEAPWGAQSTVSYNAAGHPLPEPTPSEAPTRWGGSTLSHNPARHPLPEPTPSEAPTKWGAESTAPLNAARRRLPASTPSEAPESVASFVKAARHPLPESTPSEAASRAPESVFSTGAARHPLPEPTPSEAPWGAQSAISYNTAARHPLPGPTPSEAPGRPSERQSTDTDEAPPPPYPELSWDRPSSPVPSVDSDLSIKSDKSLLRDALAHREKMIKYVDMESDLMRDIGELKEDGAGGVKDKGLKTSELKAVRSKMEKMQERAAQKFYNGQQPKSLSNEIDVSGLTAPKALDLVEGRLAALVAADLIDKPALVTIPKGTKGKPVKQKLLSTLKEHGFLVNDDPNNGRIMRITLPKN